MRLGRDQSNSTYVCVEAGCTFQWGMQEGYFQVKDGVMKYPANAHQLLKPALVREHGYLYIASIFGRTAPEKNVAVCSEGLPQHNCR